VGVIELVGVPFDGYGRPGHQARAAAALHGAGLAHAFEGHQVVDSGDLELPAPSPERGATQA
jgi:arginase